MVFQKLGSLRCLSKESNYLDKIDFDKDIFSLVNMKQLIDQILNKVKALATNDGYIDDDLGKSHLNHCVNIIQKLFWVLIDQTNSLSQLILDFFSQ